jgi:transglutaminase-like putative cysteine protease
MNRSDGWRLRVVHETRFDYDSAARASYNELRLTPRTELRQTALETRIVTMPSAQQYSYVDYWGTHVVAFNVDRRHEVLSITGHALIDTQTSEQPDDCSWEDVGDAAFTMADHLGHNLYTQPSPELAAIAAELRRERPLDTARAVFAYSHDALSYVRGVTGVHTSANEAYADGAGVCQDFAHLALALSRAVGLPSRYVSGYFHPDPDATVGEEVTGSGGGTTQPTTSRWASDTSRSAAAVTTPTYRRSRASTPGTPRTRCEFRCG